MRYNLSRDFWQNEPKLGHRDADVTFTFSEVPTNFSIADVSYDTSNGTKQIGGCSLL
jgi:hypothetical protein